MIQWKMIENNDIYSWQQLKRKKNLKNYVESSANLLTIFIEKYRQDICDYHLKFIFQIVDKNSMLNEKKKHCTF